MKALGPIPTEYALRDGELAIGGRTASALAKEARETPLFVYSREIIEQRIAGLRKAMPERLDIHYAMKANSYGPLLEFMADLVDGLDIASSGELQQAREAEAAAEAAVFFRASDFSIDRGQQLELPKQLLYRGGFQTVGSRRDYLNLEPNRGPLTTESRSRLIHLVEEGVFRSTLFPPALGAGLAHSSFA